MGRRHRYIQSTQDQTVREKLLLDLDELARQVARKMLASALEAEVEAYLDAASGQRDFYHYGSCRLRSLDWIRQSITAT